jgi:hypothetical protein
MTLKNLQIDWLKCFVTVVDTGSLSHNLKVAVLETLIQFVGAFVLKVGNVELLQVFLIFL